MVAYVATRLGPRVAIFAVLAATAAAQRALAGSVHAASTWLDPASMPPTVIVTSAVEALCCTPGLELLANLDDLRSEVARREVGLRGERVVVCQQRHDLEAEQRVVVDRFVGIPSSNDNE